MSSSSYRELEQVEKDNATRLRRSRKWAKAAQELLAVIKKGDVQLPQGDAAHFIFWWVAFESLFAIGGKRQGKMKEFVKSMVILDEDGIIAKALAQESENVLALVELRATHSGLWVKPGKDQLRLYKNHDEWEERFNEEVGVVKQAEDISEVMKILFERLRTVRNQVFHGANSLADSHGRSQVSLGAELLAVFVPGFLEIVEKSIDTSPPKDWRQVSYPRIGERDQKDIRPIWEEEPEEEPGLEEESDLGKESDDNSNSNSDQ